MEDRVSELYRRSAENSHNAEQMNGNGEYHRRAGHGELQHESYGIAGSYIHASILYRHAAETHGKHHEQSLDYERSAKRREDEAHARRDELVAKEDRVREMEERGKAAVESAKAAALK